MAASLSLGAAHAGQHQADGLLVLLGDMPLISSSHIDQMLAVFAACDHPGCIIQAENDGQAGHPVLIPRTYFKQLTDLKGDFGARSLLQQHRDHVQRVNIGPAALRDFDTPEAFDQSGG